MSKKHFELLAKNISFINDEQARKKAAMAVGAACAVSNSNFDWARFMRACGIYA
jgi:hypothetical protein